MAPRSTGSLTSKAQRDAWDVFMLERGMTVRPGSRERDMQAAFKAGWQARKRASYQALLVVRRGKR